MNNYREAHLDFKQAKAKHLLFKSRLRSILYGSIVDEAPVASHLECNVGKWIYDHALQAYGHMEEMHQLERVHKDIHTSARHLIKIYKEGKVEEAQQKLVLMETIADDLVHLLDVLEEKVNDYHMQPILPLEPDNGSEITELLRLNQELDKKIKEQVAESVYQKERFNLIAKATQDAVWDWDLRTNKVWWNEGFTTLFGFRKEETEPGIESWTNRIHPDDKERVIESINNVINSNGTKWSKEYRFKCANNTYAYVYDRSYCVLDDEGRPVRMVGSMQDITKAKKFEEDLILKNQQLIKTNNDLDNFIYTASHDLKSPISNLEGLLTLLRKNIESKIDSNDIAILNMINNSVLRFKNTINDLTEVTKAHLHINEDVENVIIQEILDDVLIELKPLANEYRATINSDLQESCIEISRKDLHSILQNLISNGIKYSSSDRPSEIFIKSELINKVLILTVQDNGLGFDLKNKEKVFGMFRRLHSHVEGAGIGLYMVKKIVENYGGNIEVHSEPGIGTKFTVRIPC